MLNGTWLLQAEKEGGRDISEAGTSWKEWQIVQLTLEGHKKTEMGPPSGEGVKGQGS